MSIVYSWSLFLGVLQASEDLRSPKHAAVTITLSAIMLFARPGEAAKPPRVTDLEARIKKLEATVAGLVDRMRRLETRGADEADNGAVPTFKSLIDGNATILADDGTFLGVISNDRINPKSIMNEIGRHGSTVGAESIFNDIGKYGNSVATTSARNDLASHPPKIYLNDKFIGFLTTNEFKSPRVGTDALIAYLRGEDLITSPHLSHHNVSRWGSLRKLIARIGGGY